MSEEGASLRECFAREDEARPDMTPLIDVVFILLIFFLVTTTFAKDLGFEVSRPEAANTAEVERQAIRVAVDAGHNLAVDGERINAWRLEAELRDRLAHQDDASVLVYADRRVDADALVRVMDRCRSAGARDIALAVQESR